MYKVEEKLLTDITKLFDKMAIFQDSGWCSVMEKELNKAKKLSKYIKNNYTEIKV